MFYVYAPHANGFIYSPVPDAYLFTADPRTALGFTTAEAAAYVAHHLCLRPEQYVIIRMEFI